MSVGALWMAAPVHAEHGFAMTRGGAVAPRGYYRSRFLFVHKLSEALLKGRVLCG